MLTQMFHQRHQRNHQMNGKHPIQKIHSRQESTTVQTLIASSINKKSTVNPEIIRFTPNALQLFLGEIKKKKKKSNDNTSIPRTNPTKQNPSRSTFAPDIRPMFAQHLPLREKITIILVGAGVVTAVVSICSEISPGPRCL